MVVPFTIQRCSLCEANPPAKRFPFQPLKELCVMNVIPDTPIEGVQENEDATMPDAFSTCEIIVLS
jgi:hypothetical protein